MSELIISVLYDLLFCWGIPQCKTIHELKTITGILNDNFIVILFSSKVSAKLRNDYNRTFFLHFNLQTESIIFTAHTRNLPTEDTWSLTSPSNFPMSCALSFLASIFLWRGGWLCAFLPPLSRNNHPSLSGLPASGLTGPVRRKGHVKTDGL